ncbi:hypothetical protein J6590_065100 [Homalodisca vitripennis]|nr:hypothetical protein J6590_065100 [Homalodisca vitripennis]
MRQDGSKTLMDSNICGLKTVEFGFKKKKTRSPAHILHDRLDLTELLGILGNRASEKNFQGHGGDGAVDGGGYLTRRQQSDLSKPQYKKELNAERIAERKVMTTNQNWWLLLILLSRSTELHFGPFCGRHLAVACALWISKS